MATIITPSLIILVDDTIDVSFLIDSSEEEEEKGKDKNKELEVFVVEHLSESDVLLPFESEDNLEHKYRKYPKPHLNLIFPPPEFV